MNPPTRPVRRRGAAAQINSAVGLKSTSDGSPNPFASHPKHMQSGVELRRPRSSQRVSIGWQEGEDIIPGRTSKLQIELAECIETKVVTTTTTTKRSYPPLLIQQQSLDKLDAKEYPLAFKPMPAELTKFSYEVDGHQNLNSSDDAFEVRQREVGAIRLFLAISAENIL